MLRTLFWQSITAKKYVEAYKKFGGSVITHPKVLNFIQENISQISNSYYISSNNKSSYTALCRWGNVLAGDIKYLERNVNSLFDFGEPEIILPSSDLTAKNKQYLWLKYHNLSELNKLNIINLKLVKKSRNHIAFVKDYSPGGEVSSKTKNTRKRKWKNMQAHGGQLRSVNEFSAKDLSEIYRDLYKKRRLTDIKNAGALQEYFQELKDMLHGYVLFMGNTPCAYQLVLRAYNPNWVSYEYINGGVDPEFKDLSPGTVLMWLNTLSAWQECASLSKSMRYSFGRNRGGAYKANWCKPVNTYCASII